MTIEQFIEMIEAEKAKLIAALDEHKQTDATGLDSLTDVLIADFPSQLLDRIQKEQSENVQRELETL